MNTARTFIMFLSLVVYGQVAIFPAAAASDLDPATPWKSAVSLLKDPNDHGPIIGVQPAGDFVYVAFGGYPVNRDTFLSVERLPIDGSSPILIGKLPIRPGPDTYNSMDRHSLCVAPKDIFVRHEGDGIVDFPLDGRPPFRFGNDAASPSPDIRSMAWLDGHLYAGLADHGHIVRFDPLTHKTELLASANRAQPDSPLDRCKSFHIVWMVGDSQRGRLVFFLSEPSEDHNISGFWEWSPTNHFRQLWAVPPPAFVEHATSPHDDKVLLALNASGFLAVEFNLATNTPTVLYAHTPQPAPPSVPHTGLDRSHPLFTGDQLFGLFVQCNNTLWCGNPWSQLSPQTTQAVPLPPLAKPVEEGQHFIPDLYLDVTPDGKHMLVANDQGIWSLELP